MTKRGRQVRTWGWKCRNGIRGLLVAALVTVIEVPEVFPAEPEPGAWREQAVGSGAPALPPGPVWMRAWMQVPDALAGDSGPDLWRDSMTLTLGSLPGPVEVFLNGRRMVNVRDLPDGELRRFKVPKGILVKGAFNAWVVRLDGAAATRGLVVPPVFAGYFDEIRMDRPWQITATEPAADERREVVGTPPSATVYGAADFRPSTTVMSASPEPERGRQVSPAEALALLQPASDLRVEDLLHEPLVAQPTHLSFDARGRLWVAQYRQYPFPAGVRMISRDKYYRSKYDRLPAPPSDPAFVPGADVISLHEDRDGDGTYEIHRQVLTGLNLANAVLHGHGGIWVMQSPYLLFYPDANRDDAPDGPPEIRLQGFGLEDTHSVANGLAWGPDGWLYGAQGSTTTSRVTRPDRDPPSAPGVHVEGCMVWRYHPERRLYEIFADGSGNTFGVAFDGEGRLFTGHNGGDTRGWHHVQEGQYLKQGKDPAKFGPAPNPFAYGEMPMMRSTHPVPRFTHVTLWADGIAMPERWRGRFLGADPLHHQIIAADRRATGATFETTDSGIPLQTGDLTFRPVYLANAPDGSVLIADFREEYIAHGQNYQSQIDPSTGRIYRLRGRHQTPERQTDLESLTTAELIPLLGHAQSWQRQTAVRLLAERRDAAVVPQVRAAFDDMRLHPALEALWVLHQLGALNASSVQRGLRHPEPMVRAWTIRLVGDERSWPAEMDNLLLSVAATDADATVRSQVLSTARRLPASQALPLVAAVARRTEDLDDPFIPLQAWFALEPLCGSHREAVLDVFRDPAFWTAPLVRRDLAGKVMRRWADSGTRQELTACAALLRQAPGEKDRNALLRGFEEAFRGRPLPVLPDALATALAASGERSRILRIRQGDAVAVGEALSDLGGDAIEPARRLEAIRSLGEIRHVPALPEFVRLATHPGPAAPRLAALAALQPFEDPSVGTALVAAWPGLPAEVRVAAVNLLASRAAWSREMLDSVAAGTIPPEMISEDLKDRMRRFQDAAVDRRLAVLGGSGASVVGDAASSIASLRATLAAAPGDPYRGEPLFAERCGTCHTLFFKGGRIGPDLTAYQRDDLGTLLPAILTPSVDIREGFENVLVETRDGRVLSGFLADQDAHLVVLRGVDGADLALPRAEVLSVEPAGRSLMPEGLLDDWTPSQLQDFFAYLRQSQPITK
ncbi:MAG: dehydrogenase [Verrucomicrobia bacterium]|nr:dehydrogenase [Verrucomicrobiota bacterium]